MSGIVAGDAVVPRRDSTPTPPKPDLTDYVTVRELDARVATVVTELKWHRGLMALLVAATMSPKLGGPAVSQLTAQVIHHLT